MSVWGKEMFSPLKERRNLRGKMRTKRLKECFEERHEKGNGDASGREDIQIRTKASQGAYRARFSLRPASIILRFRMSLILPRSQMHRMSDQSLWFNLRSLDHPARSSKAAESDRRENLDETPKLKVPIKQVVYEHLARWAMKCYVLIQSVHQRYVAAPCNWVACGILLNVIILQSLQRKNVNTL